MFTLITLAAIVLAALIYGLFKAKASPEAAVAEVEADAAAKVDSAETEAKTLVDNAEAVVVKDLPKV